MYFFFIGDKQWANDGIVDCLNGFDEDASSGLRSMCPERFPQTNRKAKKKPAAKKADATVKGLVPDGASCEAFEAAFYLPSSVSTDLAIIRGTLEQCQEACCAAQSCAGFSRDVGEKKGGPSAVARCWLKSNLPAQGRVESDRYQTWVMVKK